MLHELQPWQTSLTQSSLTSARHHLTGVQIAGFHPRLILQSPSRTPADCCSDCLRRGHQRVRPVMLTDKKSKCFVEYRPGTMALPYLCGRRGPARDSWSRPKPWETVTSYVKTGTLHSPQARHRCLKEHLPPSRGC